MASQSAVLRFCKEVLGGYCTVRVPVGTMAGDLRAADVAARGGCAGWSQLVAGARCHHGGARIPPGTDLAARRGAGACRASFRFLPNRPGRRVTTFLPSSSAERIVVHRKPRTSIAWLNGPAPKALSFSSPRPGDVGGAQRLGNIEDQRAIDVSSLGLPRSPTSLKEFAKNAAGRSRAVRELQGFCRSGQTAGEGDVSRHGRRMLGLTGGGEG